jgi:hypothetical protein
MSLVRIVSAAFALSLAVLSAPPPARAVDVESFKGSITDVGVQRGPGQIGGVEYRTQGTFLYAGPIDLSISTITFTEMFAENGPGGRGELMTTTDDASFLPISFPADDSSEVDESKYESHSFRPHIRMVVENDGGEFEFKFKLDRGLMRTRPALCTFDPQTRKEYTFITFSFTITDGVNPPLDVSTTNRWECTKPDRYHMRSR